MPKLFRLLTFIALTCSIYACQHKRPYLSQAQLIKAYQVKTEGRLEPSGLTEWDGKFYTVSDKQDYIYQLVFDEAAASVSLKPIIKINNDRNTKLDFEGITHDIDNFYLMSEMYFQILKVSKDGKQQSWMPQDDRLKTSGQQAGLFQVHNAYFEGICYLSKDKFLLAAERDPRGFVEVDFAKNIINAYQANITMYKIDENRSTDFTGLSCDDKIYVLERNQYIVSELQYYKGQLREVRGWSFQNIIKQAKFLYQDMRYGHAEGLVVKKNKIYLILDNNRNPHQNNDDNNSLFLVLRKSK